MQRHTHHAESLIGLLPVGIGHPAVEPQAEPSHNPAQMVLPPVEGREGARMGMPHASGRAVALVMRIAHVSAKVVDKPAGR